MSTDQIIRPPVIPGPPEPPHKRWYQRKLVWAAGAVAVLAVIGGVSSAVSTKPVTKPATPATSAPAAPTTPAPTPPKQTTPTTPAPTPTKPAPAPPKQTTPTTPAPAPADQLVAWWDTSGQTDLGNVSADLQALQTDSANLATAAQAADEVTLAAGAATLESDAQTLISDAGTALANPPPAPLNTNWNKAMNGLVIAANQEKEAAQAIQAGDYVSAATWLEKATASLTDVALPALQNLHTQVLDLLGQ